jgi:hypothetical protein
MTYVRYLHDLYQFFHFIHPVHEIVIKTGKSSLRSFDKRNLSYFCPLINKSNYCYERFNILLFSILVC